MSIHQLIKPDSGSSSQASGNSGLRVPSPGNLRLLGFVAFPAASPVQSNADEQTDIDSLGARFAVRMAADPGVAAPGAGIKTSGNAYDVFWRNSIQ